MTLPINVIFGHLQVGRLGSAPCYGWWLTTISCFIGRVCCCVREFLKSPWQLTQLTKYIIALLWYSFFLLFGYANRRNEIFECGDYVCVVGNAALSRVWNGPEPRTHHPNAEKNKGTHLVVRGHKDADRGANHRLWRIHEHGIGRRRRDWKETKRGGENFAQGGRNHVHTGGQSCEKGIRKWINCFESGRNSHSLEKQYNFANCDGLVNHEKDDDEDVRTETAKNGLVEWSGGIPFAWEKRLAYSWNLVIRQHINMPSSWTCWTEQQIRTHDIDPTFRFINLEPVED